MTTDPLPTNAFLLYGISGLAIAGLAATLTALLVRHLRILDVPNERSSHSNPTPRGGGLAIVCAFLAGLTLLAATGEIPAGTAAVQGFLAALLLIAAISFYDDMRSLSLSIRTIVQLLAIAIVIATNGAAAMQPLGWIAIPLTLLWIFGLTNAFNFMDGLDGLAASTAAIAGAFLAFIAWTQNAGFVCLTAGTLSAATLGFLAFNWPPARIFMGDVGSTCLGFTLACLAIFPAPPPVGAETPVTLTMLTTGPLLVVPLLLFHFIFDTVFTFLRRLLRGEKVWLAHRSHLYQLLNRAGQPHRTVTLLYSAMALGQGLGTVWMTHAPADRAIPVLLLLLAVHAAHATAVMRLARRQHLI